MYCYQLTSINKTVILSSATIKLETAFSVWVASAKIMQLIVGVDCIVPCCYIIAYTKKTFIALIIHSSKN